MTYLRLLAGEISLERSTDLIDLLLGLVLGALDLSTTGCNKQNKIELEPVYSNKTL